MNSSHPHDRPPPTPPYDCAAAAEDMQLLLDGIAAADLPALQAHCNECPECRRQVAAARHLLHGLERLPRPSVPFGLAERAYRAVRSDRRQRLQRQWLAAGAGLAAASVLAALFVFSKQQPPAPQGGPSAWEVAGNPLTAGFEEGLHKVPPPAPLRDRLAEAGSAVAELTRRTADETFERTVSLLPRPTLPKPADPTERLEPAFQSLAEVGTSAAAGVEPIAASARRAVDLFWREIAPSDMNRKPRS
jgi:hypothetical protein